MTKADNRSAFVIYRFFGKSLALTLLSLNRYFSLTQTFTKVSRLLAMAKFKQVWLCSFSLTQTFTEVSRLLAMAKFKQVWLCSFSLTQTF